MKEASEKNKESTSNREHTHSEKCQGGTSPALVLFGEESTGDLRRFCSICFSVQVQHRRRQRDTPTWQQICWCSCLHMEKFILKVIIETASDALRHLLWAQHQSPASHNRCRVDYGTCGSRAGDTVVALCLDVSGSNYMLHANA